MHHVRIEGWSARQSFLHRRDPRAKSLVLLTFLIAIGTADRRFAEIAACSVGLFLFAVITSRLPLGGILARSALVLPFSLTFALISYISGDAHRAWLLTGKSYLSALGVLVLMATTPLPQLLRGLEEMHVPRHLLMVMQFLYRYLFVISEEAQHMRAAGACRGGTLRGLQRRRAGFSAAAGILGVLFARSHARAQGVHYAMLSRGFSGSIPALDPLHFATMDAIFLAAGVALFSTLRLVAGAA